MVLTALGVYLCLYVLGVVALDWSDVELVLFPFLVPGLVFVTVWQVMAAVAVSAARRLRRVIA